MGKPRIEYQSGSLELSINKEEFFIFIHYANTLNLDKARKLYFAGETAFMYRRDNGLSTDGLDYYDSHHTYLNTVDLYYAKQVNENKAKKLFDATLTEYRYRIRYNLALEGLTYKDYEAHFVPSDILDAIAFIDNELVNALNNENEDLLVKYGGNQGFLNKYYTNPGYLSALGVEDDEFYYDSPSDIIHYSQLLKEFFQYALGLNTVYNIFVQ